MPATALLEWELDFGPEVVRLVLRGEMDMSAADVTAPAVEAVAHVADRVVIDLAGVTFLDGGGLDVLMDVAQRLAGHGVEIVYGTMARPVDRYLGLRGISLFD